MQQRGHALVVIVLHTGRPITDAMSLTRTGLVDVARVQMLAELSALSTPMLLCVDARDVSIHGPAITVSGFSIGTRQSDDAPANRSVDT